MTLEARAITAQYPGARTRALDGVTLSLAPGELVAVAGANGSGKSTLCHALAGVLDLERGDALLDGAPIEALAPGRVQLIQQRAEDQVVAPVVRDDVAFGLQCLDLPVGEVAVRVRTWLHAVGLAAMADRTIDTLSGGEVARVALAGALAMEPDFLLVDEPTAHLDPDTGMRFVEWLRQAADRGAGVLLVTHRLEDAAAADRLVLMQAGRVVAEGDPRALLYDVALLEHLDLAPPPIVDLVHTWRAAGHAIDGAPLTEGELVAAACPASN